MSTAEELVAFAGLPNVPPRARRSVGTRAARPAVVVPAVSADAVAHQRDCPRLSPVIVRDTLTREGDIVSWCGDCMRHGLSAPDREDPTA